MTFFIFDKSLESGIELIDDQHRKIVEVANTFFVSYEHGHGGHRAPETIAFLEQYILYHFNAEEAYQSDSEYPKYREHQAQHSYLATQLKFHSVNLKRSNYSYENAEAFNVFFRDWIITHLMNQDLEFLTYYKEHGGITPQYH